MQIYIQSNQEKSPQSYPLNELKEKHAAQTSANSNYKDRQQSNYKRFTLSSSKCTKQSRARLAKLTQIKQQQTVYLNVLHQFTCARHWMLMACNACHVTLAIENKFTFAQKRRQKWDKGGP